MKRAIARLLTYILVKMFKCEVEYKVFYPVKQKTKCKKTQYEQFKF